MHNHVNNLTSLIHIPRSDYGLRLFANNPDHKKSFEMAADGPDNLVDAAAVEGIVLPFSCRGGVCATCRTYVRSGEVRMATNHGLEPWEVEKGFVLACQAQPLSSKLTLDYDET